MGLQPLENLQGVSYSVVGIVVTIVVIAMLSRRPNLGSFPTVGACGFLGSWWAGFKFMINAAEVIQEGYEKHKPAPFKVAGRYGWTVVVSDRRHVEELARAPEDELSFTEAIDEKLNTQYTLRRQHHPDPNFSPFIRSQLSRKTATTYPEMRDEIIAAFDEVLDIKGDDWKSVPALSCVQRVICRTSNRIFVGLPLCRTPDWINLNIQYAIDIALAAQVIGLFPNFLKPLVARFFPGIFSRVKLANKLLIPIIEERLKHSNKPEYNAENPNDLLSWSMDDDRGMTVKSLVTRMLVANFTAIHTSSNSFTHALLYLAANPQCILLLREEVESIVGKEGWSKASVSKMHKVDSFLRECQRIEGLHIIDLTRKALKDFAFSDGTFIPKGTTIGVPVRALHYDKQLYEDANLFEPLRFVERRDDEGKGVKHRYASTAFDYLGFGHGKHACPGRFFAAMELKTMLAHIVVTYDVKLQDNTTRPRSLHFGTWIIPHPFATVMFRKRVD